MDTKETIALVSAVIAAASLAFNIYQAITIQKLRQRDVARDELTGTLRSLQERLEYTRLFDVEPNQEIWEFGFKSLHELAAVCAAAHVATQHSKYASPQLREAVSGLNDHVKALRSLHDSYSTAAHGQSDAPARIQETWKDWERAKASLQAAQPVANSCKRLISEHLRNNDRS